MSTVQGGQGNIVTSGLILNLDAANPRSYPPAYNGTTWFNLASSSFNGTLTNGPIYNSTNGGSIVFDGVDDYTLLPNVGVSNLSAFSVSFWARTSTGGINCTAYSEGTPSSWPSNLFIIYFGNTNDGGRCRVWFGFPSVGDALIGTTVVNNNRWYYVTYNQTNTSNRTLAINTVVEATNTSTITSTATNASIGANNNNGTFTQFYNGSLANITVYNRALSSSEITQNFQATRARFGI